MKYRVLEKQENSRLCFVCGIDNDASAKASFYICQKDDNEKILLTIVQPREIHQSYPGRMHGGVISALLDESIGRSANIQLPDIWAVTIDLQVKFRKAVPLDQTLYIESKTTDIGTRAFDGEGKLFLRDGTVCATAKGKFFIVPIEKAIPDADVKGMQVMVEEDLPEFIDLTSNQS